MSLELAMELLAPERIEQARAPLPGRRKARMRQVGLEAGKGGYSVGA
jgi:hypothetical protein